VWGAASGRARIEYLAFLQPFGRECLHGNTGCDLARGALPAAAVECVVSRGGAQWRLPGAITLPTPDPERVAVVIECALEGQPEVAALGQDDLKRLLETAAACMLDVLVEVHDREELDRALETDARIIGVNNRNLKTFEVHLETTGELGEEVPDDLVLVSESGIRTVEDVRRVREWGADAILVGEALMRSGNPGQTIQEFMAIL
jgi:hypothetical protein